MSCKGDTRIRCFIPPESITEAYLLYIFTGISMCVCSYINIYIGIPTEFSCMLASDRPWPANVKKNLSTPYAQYVYSNVCLGESTGTGWVRTA